MMPGRWRAGGLLTNNIFSFQTFCTLKLGSTAGVMMLWCSPPPQGLENGLSCPLPAGISHQDTRVPKGGAGPGGSLFTDIFIVEYSPNLY